MPSDLEIAHATTLRPLADVAADVDLTTDDLEFYGPHKAKISFDAIKRINADRSPGKLILVTAVTPTPAGEGKTTMAVGLSQALAKLGKRSLVAIREPSFGPVFGLKGGATGGGYAQVLPMEDINLHFTGDSHAITLAHNLLVALLDSHIHNGNALEIDLRSITIKRTIDLCDRALRDVVVALGGATNGLPRQTGYEITAACEMMAIVTLSRDIADLKERLGRMVVASTTSGRPVTAAHLHAVGAMAATLRDAMKPNLVQTVEGTPALVHAGPFGNVSFGSNSVIATTLGRHLSDYLVTEAGFGSDLGAEKFLNIKCRSAGIMPDAVVVAATIRALKYQGGADLEKLSKEDVGALKAGLPNLFKHIENMQHHGLSPVVGINQFTSDTEAEIATIQEAVEALGVPVALADVWGKGGDGGRELAELVLTAVDEPDNRHHLYPDEDGIEEKIGKITSLIYGAEGVRYLPSVRKKIQQFEAQGYGRMPVCIAKTHRSLSDVSSLRGRPEGFSITINDIKANVGAGYIVAYAGNIMTMPGMGAKPAAHDIDLSDDGIITGLF